MSASKNGGGGRDTALKQKKKRRRRRKPPRESTLAIIDRHLLARVQATLNGELVWITAFEAIMYQLMKKERAGDVHAGRVLMGYEDLATSGTVSQLELEFVASDYTRSFAESPKERGDG